MIVTDTSREVPTFWADDLCFELFHHARELGIGGNPGGYMLTVGLFPFVGYEDEGVRYILPYKEWDYDGIRAWIAEHPESVKVTWQRVVRGYW